MPNDRQYEFVYVLAPTVANAEVEALQRELEEQIGRLDGAVENTDLWGRRKLAYPIGNFTEGIYVVQLIRGPGAMVTELERRMRVHDDVLRYLTVRVDDDLRKARRAAEKRKADAERRRAARGPQPQVAGSPQSGAEPAGESPAEGRSPERTAPEPEVKPAEAEPEPGGAEPVEAAAGEPTPPESAGPVSEDSPAEGEPVPPSGEEPPPAAASDEAAGD